MPVIDQLQRHLNFRFWLYAALIAAVSLWLRDGVPLWAIADAQHDDLLFLLQANTILQGEWLGDYDRFTHAKPPFYSLFIALVFLLSIPLKFAEHLAYLITGFALAAYIGHQAKSRIITLFGFGLLALCPVLWHPELQRVIREGLYMPQTLGVMALAAYCFLSPTRVGLSRWAALIGFGVFFSGFWMTREEGIWLIPSLILLIIAGVIIAWFESKNSDGDLLSIIRKQASNTAVFALVAILGVMSVAAINYSYYSSFRINDFQTRDFAAAYGAIIRVTDPAPQNLVPASSEKLELIYAASPTAAEMAPHLRGDVGAFWGEVGCTARPLPGCEHILSGWFQWAIRDAADEAGHYTSALKANQYFERLAREINQACDNGSLSCGPEQHSMTPKFSSELIAPLFREIWAGTMLSLSQTDGKFGAPPSAGHPRNRGLFADMTGHTVRPWSDPTNAEASNPRSLELSVLRIALARHVTQAQSIVTLLALIIAVLGTMIVMFSRERLMRLNWHLVTLTMALGGAVAARIVLLAYVHVTAQPAINPLYFSPGIVLVPALAACWLAALWPAFRKST